MEESTITQIVKKTSALKKNLLFALLLAGLCVATYLPMFDNGYISDDYVIIARLESLAHDPFFLFSTPPECFRLTSYLCFGALKLLFGYHAAGYYSFNLLLHLINSLLVWMLVSRLSNSDRTGKIASILFATMQGHQEAVMWLAAMNETLQGVFILLCLLIWQTRFRIGSALLYIPALFSKESALILMGLAPWIDQKLKRIRGNLVEYGLLGGISLAFIGLVYSLASANFMINAGTYSPGLHAVTVFFVSMHRMLFPYVYLAIIAAVLQWKWMPPAAGALRGLGFAAIALLPYLFLTYQNHVPSRQEYLASIGIAWMLAALLINFKRSSWRSVFIVLFIFANIGYIWFRKDAQFEVRAAPTSQLLEILKDTPPQKLSVIDFPYNPWVAKNTALHAGSWNPELLYVNQPTADCGNCLTYRWDSDQNRYMKLTANAR